MAVLGFLVFAAALAASAWTLYATIAPALPRIAAILRGEGDPSLVPVPALVLSERRVRARVRSAAPARALPLRAAA